MRLGLKGHTRCGRTRMSCNAEPDDCRRSRRLEVRLATALWDAREPVAGGIGDLDQQHTTTLAARSVRQKGLVRSTAAMAPGGRSTVEGIGRVGMRHGLGSPDFSRRPSHGVASEGDDIVCDQIVVVWAWGVGIVLGRNDQRENDFDQRQMNVSRLVGMGVRRSGMRRRRMRVRPFALRVSVTDRRRKQRTSQKRCCKQQNQRVMKVACHSRTTVIAGDSWNGYRPAWPCRCIHYAMCCESMPRTNWARELVWSCRRLHSRLPLSRRPWISTVAVHSCSRALSHARRVSE